MSTSDPLVDGMIRVVQVHARDGLSELSDGLTFAMAATVPALKLWWPIAAQMLTLPLIAVVFGLTFVIRRATDQKRLTLAQGGSGYAGPGKLQLRHLVLVVAPALIVALMARAGLVTTDHVLIITGILYGGVQILKVRYTGVRRRIWLGILTAAMGMALAYTNWSFLFCAFVAALTLALVNTVAGLVISRHYQRSLTESKT